MADEKNSRRIKRPLSFIPDCFVVLNTQPNFPEIRGGLEVKAPWSGSWGHRPGGEGGGGDAAIRTMNTRTFKKH